MDCICCKMDCRCWRRSPRLSFMALLYLYRYTLQTENARPACSSLFGLLRGHTPDLVDLSTNGRDAQPEPAARRKRFPDREPLRTLVAGRLPKHRFGDLNGLAKN